MGLVAIPSARPPPWTPQTPSLLRRGYPNHTQFQVQAFAQTVFFPLNSLPEHGRTLIQLILAWHAIELIDGGMGDSHGTSMEGDELTLIEPQRDAWAPGRLT